MTMDDDDTGLLRALQRRRLVLKPLRFRRRPPSSLRAREAIQFRIKEESAIFYASELKKTVDSFLMR